VCCHYLRQSWESCFFIFKWAHFCLLNTSQQISNVDYHFHYIVFNEDKNEHVKNLTEHLKAQQQPSWTSCALLWWNCEQPSPFSQCNPFPSPAVQSKGPVILFFQNYPPSQIPFIEYFGLLSAFFCLPKCFYFWRLKRLLKLKKTYILSMLWIVVLEGNVCSFSTIIKEEMAVVLNEALEKETCLCSQSLSFICMNWANIVYFNIFLVPHFKT